MKIKTLTGKEMRTKKPAELTAYIESLKKDRTSLLLELQSGKSKQTHQLGELRRSIAQAHTLVTEMTSEAQPTSTKENK